MTTYSSDNNDDDRDEHQLEHERRLRTVKTVALGMGALIVLGVAALGYGMYAKADRVGKSGDAAGQTAAAAGKAVSVPVAMAPQAGLAVFGSIILDAADGAEIVDVQTSGTVLTVTVLEATGPSLHVIDLTAGRVLGKVALKAPAAGQHTPIPGR